MKLKTYSIDLTLEELRLIDGMVSEEAQKIINKAKQEFSYGFELPIMNEILRKSEETGELTWKYKQIRSCEYCDKKYGYHTYSRNSKYHDKGDRNYNSPMYYNGIAFNERFITTQGVGDMCADCEKEYNIIHRLIDYIIDNDLKIEIQKNDYKPSKYLKDEIRICYKCNKEIKESEMGNMPTVMGGRYYKGVCPYCGAESVPFGKSHKITNKFDFVLNPWFNKEVQNIKQLVEEYNDKIENKENKIQMCQSKKNSDMFIIEEVKWTNGYNKVVSFDINEKIYKVGRFWKNKTETNTFINELKKYSYKIKEGDK